MGEEELQKKVEKYSRELNKIKKEIKKPVLGLESTIDNVIKALVCDGHIMLEGVPGTAKTLLVRSLAKTISDVKFQRIQFTPDLLPSDITGMTVYRKGKGFEVKKGPIFGNIIAADEINRTTPKVQSAMLQAMQEREVTIGKKTFSLPEPFMVLATQNPLETRGVYPLPEAQIDRFLFWLKVRFAPRDQEKKIIESNIEVKTLEDFDIKEVLSPEEVLNLQSFVQRIKCNERVKRYAVDLVFASRYPEKYDLEMGKYIKWGGSPRASIYLTLGGKATALMNGRTYVIPEDVREVALPVLRHRIILNYEGKAERISKRKIVNNILNKVEII